MEKVWVAGLTSKSEDPSRGLAYLMCVERSFLSQMEIWRALPDYCRPAKSASKSELGDLFEPKATAVNNPYEPGNYEAPPHDRHVHSTDKYPNTWHRDVERWCKRRSKPHRLLLGQIAQSYRWRNVQMILRGAMGNTAHHRKYDSLKDFIDCLQKFDP